ncbi:MAG: 30S ribosomal protein S8 [Candidatus Margulisiibacteriota bacterium]
MAVTDSIADLFTRIRNALMVKHDEVNVPHSRVSQEIVRILKDEGFLSYYDVESLDLKRKVLKIGLKYNESGQPVIREIIRKSKPGNRVYVRKQHIPKVLSGFGISIVSTSRGIMSGREARISNVGGELLGVVF